MQLCPICSTFPSLIQLLLLKVQTWNEDNILPPIPILMTNNNPPKTLVTKERGPVWTLRWIKFNLWWLSDYTDAEILSFIGADFA